MPAKQTISILALSVLMILPAEMSRAGSIKVQNGNSRVTINRNGDIKIINGRRRRFYRRRFKRGSTVQIPTPRVYRGATRFCEL